MVRKPVSTNFTLTRSSRHDFKYSLNFKWMIKGTPFSWEPPRSSSPPGDLGSLTYFGSTRDPPDALVWCELPEIWTLNDRSGIHRTQGHRGDFLTAIVVWHSFCFGDPDFGKTEDILGTCNIFVRVCECFLKQVSCRFCTVDSFSLAIWVSCPKRFVQIGHLSPKFLQTHCHLQQVERPLVVGLVVAFPFLTCRWVTDVVLKFKIDDFDHFGNMLV